MDSVKTLLGIPAGLFLGMLVCMVLGWDTLGILLMVSMVVFLLFAAYKAVAWIAGKLFGRAENAMAHEQAVHGQSHVVLSARRAAVVQEMARAGEAAPVHLNNNPFTFEYIEDAMGAGDFDRARTALQKMAYIITRSGSELEKQDFKRLMTDFARLDPLYAAVMNNIEPYIRANPGTLQSALYNHFPQYTQETIRYVLYFAHELGEVFRKKKGRSYELHPPGRVIDGEVLDTH